MTHQPTVDTLSSREIVDALPAPLFLVDADLFIHDMNQAARAFAHHQSPKTVSRLCGEVLRCVHAAAGEGACGTTPFCPNCVVRQSIVAAAKGKPVVRKWAQMRRAHQRTQRDDCFLVSATRVEPSKTHLILVMIEDVTELVQLRALLPVCSSCGKVRSDDEYWHSVNDYLRKHTALRFSHGVCPTCLEQLYGADGEHVAEQMRPPDDAAISASASTSGA